MLAGGLILAAVSSAAALTLQSTGKKFPATTVAGLAAYACPAGATCRSAVTDANAMCTPGSVPTGGGSHVCRVVWNGSNWVMLSGVSNNCPSGSTLWTTGVSDHQGITLGGCSNVGTASESCGYNQPITCDATSGSATVTIHGYTPSVADVGKILVVGMPYKIAGSTTVTGAGGTGWPGQTMRGKVNSVAGQSLTLVADTNTGSSTAHVAAATVSGAECDLGTDNSPALVGAINAASAGGTVCVPPGNYQVDSAVHITKNMTIFCEPGAVFIDPRDDGLPTGSGNFFNSMFISFQGVTGGGVNGCTYMGTNTGIYWKQYPTQPDSNRFVFTAGASGLTLQNLTSLNIWGDTDLVFSTSDDVNFSNNNTVSHTFTQNGWAYGPSVVAGHGNTLDHMIMRDVCNDVEPNNTTEANQTFGNTFSNFNCIATGQFFNNTTYSSNESVGGGGPVCGTNSTCAAGQTVSGTDTVVGSVSILRGCLNGSPSGSYSGVTSSSNSTGSPQCNCGSSC